MSGTKEKVARAQKLGRLTEWMKVFADTQIAKMVYFEPVEFTPHIPPGEPTPDEIAKRCAEIRESWDEETHRDRAGMNKRTAFVETAEVAHPEFLGNRVCVYGHRDRL